MSRQRDSISMPTGAEGQFQASGGTGLPRLMGGQQWVFATSLFFKTMGVATRFVPHSSNAAANRLIVARTKTL